MGQEPPIPKIEAKNESLEEDQREPGVQNSPIVNRANMETKGGKFEPIDLEKEPLIESGLPPELWTVIQAAPATFPPNFFLDVSQNLLENPNLTSSILFRAEIFYTSDKDTSFNSSASHPQELSKFVKHMKAEYQPQIIVGGYPGYSLERTVVRKLIPRNPRVDKPLVQTCHLFTSAEDSVLRDNEGVQKKIEVERYLIVYIPHATDPEEIPFYHPKVQALAVLYAFQPNVAAGFPPGTLSLYYKLFPEQALDNRLSRTALNMLKIIHKHSRGRMAGYKKRVHHDILIPQKRFQDTYTYLKGKYAQILIRDWVEQTPPEKHVFEDLGIAAFLMELWTDMYSGKEGENAAREKTSGEELEQIESGDRNRRTTVAQQNFPGFVDIGCGNGILVSILRQESWNGWGFDARKRKTWETVPVDVRENLKEMLLVPAIFDSSPQASVHHGIFPTGTFIIANHADELTIWTPCLAFLSKSPFITIPCCSHNFAGAKFRASTNAFAGLEFPGTSIHRDTQSDDNFEGKPEADAIHRKIDEDETLKTPNTKPSKQPSKQPSAYASFCTYVTNLTAALGYLPEKEVLRIPSTRNVAILGRKASATDTIKELGGALSSGQRLAFVTHMVEQEMETRVEQLGKEWVGRGAGLMKPEKGGH
ncbi:DUF1613-domain-containing protein [Zopfia rhizophila CBS 207.26]|uniref:tRNA (uracil-O(2)-)-methyltransferase n=1 Tax=Zopfia rhizophila CBS 207.26 TaxID=1314779 RepID=A0A6A6EI44_9PEZI|nr:DUF1613-domain-containing protein [Zopfia rhizophila CBS 207.26]